MFWHRNLTNRYLHSQSFTNLPSLHVYVHFLDCIRNCNKSGTTHSLSLPRQGIQNAKGSQTQITITYQTNIHNAHRTNGMVILIEATLILSHRACNLRSTEQLETFRYRAAPEMFRYRTTSTI